MWWIFIIVAGVLLTQLGRVLTKASAGGAHSPGAPRSPGDAQPRPVPDPVAAVQRHLSRAWIQVAFGAPLFALGVSLMFTPDDTAGFIVIMCGGSLLLVAAGRIWAVGGIGTTRWSGAAVSTWRVEAAEDNEDCDGFCTWFHVQLRALDTGTADPERTTMGTPIRFFPATPDTQSGWLGRGVQVLEAADGTAVIGLTGHRYYRMGTASPWDLLDDLLGWAGERKPARSTSRTTASDAWPRGPRW